MSLLIQLEAETVYIANTQTWGCTIWAKFN